MSIFDFLKTVAYIDSMSVDDDLIKIWRSKYNHSYLGNVFFEDELKFLLDFKITDQLSFGLGFSPENNKWYGWTHRGIYGFTIGSTCKKGDVHYKPANLDDLIESSKLFWKDEFRLNVRVEKIKSGVLKISWNYTDTIENLNMRGKYREIIEEYDESSFGRGEWVAKTLDDAKEMAIDYRNNLS